MGFDPRIAEIRFGCGLAPSLSGPSSVEDMLDRLRGPDKAAKRFAIEGYDVALAFWYEDRALGRQRREAKTEAEREATLKRRKANRKQARIVQSRWLGHSLLRRALTEDGFRERLTAFWADHFTAVGTSGVTRFAHPAYAEDAIRPHVAGRFADMLKAVATHPSMIVYLDQHRSAGPNSKAAAIRKNVDGLNENLARELLELHTLGVDGPYTQADVRELAELLTGLSFHYQKGFVFRGAFTEPGAETVLGVRYGGGKGGIKDIFAALDDLAVHPGTARHVARKLAVHFISDTPDPAMIKAMTERYIATDGDLTAVYAAMLAHPAAWDPGAGNVKQPFDFIGSSLRALDITPRHMPSAKPGRMRDLFLTPMSLMGQAWGQALGPDGWPEEDAAWITPQRLAARLQWAMTAPFSLVRNLPDPRTFVDAALGAEAPEAVRFAAGAAETRSEGIAVVLASPAFQRM